MKPRLTRDELIAQARNFCINQSAIEHKELFGVTDGKAVGTYVEHMFQKMLSEHYEFQIGSSAKGIDLPSDDINTDIKVTSIKQPQSSCPFKSPREKIYGLGYNLLLFVYDKYDDAQTKSSRLNFVSCAFIHASRTADYQMTRGINEILQRND